MVLYMIGCLSRELQDHTHLLLDVLPLDLRRCIAHGKESCVVHEFLFVESTYLALMKTLILII